MKSSYFHNMKISAWSILLLFAVSLFAVPIYGESHQEKTSMEESVAKATFAGGCYWCMEPPYERMSGVKDVISGFMGGHVEDPSYEEASSGGTGHREVVQVLYDPEEISYRKLLEIYWHQIDPTDDGGQFNERGFVYTTAIFYHNERQRKLAEKSKKRLEESDVFSEPIVTAIEPADTFYRGPEEHQDYYKKNSLSYQFYRWNEGRDQFLSKAWKGHQEFKIFPDRDSE